MTLLIPDAVNFQCGFCGNLADVLGETGLFDCLSVTELLFLDFSEKSKQQ